MTKTKRTREDQWQAVFYETARGQRPAWDFLTDKKTPIDVQIELLTTVRAVLLRSQSKGKRARHAPIEVLAA